MVRASRKLEKDEVMLIMISSHASLSAGYLAGKYPEQLGHLFSPGAQRGPWKFMPYALDNGKFPCWSKGTAWDEIKFLKLLDWAKMSGQQPLWVLVPDEVANPVETLRLWALWMPEIKRYGWPLAFAAQDGHTVSDIPRSADVVFLGGTTKWKHKNIKRFCSGFPRVHVGRINGLEPLRRCWNLGVESCDGTGWFRGDKRQLMGLEVYLDETANGSRQTHISVVGIPSRQCVTPQIGDIKANIGWHVPSIGEHCD
jgi:hypothetical protein